MIIVSTGRLILSLRSNASLNVICSQAGAAWHLHLASPWVESAAKQMGCVMQRAWHLHAHLVVWHLHVLPDLAALPATAWPGHR